jgi:hypothetical protein
MSRRNTGKVLSSFQAKFSRLFNLPLFDILSDPAKSTRRSLPAETNRAVSKRDNWISGITGFPNDCSVKDYLNYLDELM